jgi:glycosyltransferase involved in cell wall biosynthesis
MKKVLYFFPDNIGIQNSGNKTRAIHFLKYLASKGYDVNYVSLKHEKEDMDSEQATIDYINTNKLASKVHLLPRKPGKKSLITYFFKYKLRDLLYYLFAFPLKSSIPTFITVKLKDAFETILKEESFDYIIISYVFYADLVGNTKLLGKSKLIIDTHDFITGQFKDKRNFNLGVTFADEISRLNAFHEIWAISTEEKYIYSQFCKSTVRLVSMMMDKPVTVENLAARKKYHLIYVASNNIHNIKSAAWFFDNVYPLLPKDLDICVIGKINNHIKGDYDIHRVLHAPSLDEYYNNAEVAICPMLSGTGVKVKVVEALSFGLPVVCNESGTDGLPNKTDNGCLVSNNPVEYTELIMQLLNSPQFYHQQSMLAKAFFQKSFETSTVLHVLDQAFGTD